MTDCDFSLHIWDPVANIPNYNLPPYNPNLTHLDNQHFKAFTCAEDNCYDYDGECIRNEMLECLRTHFGDNIFNAAVWQTDDSLTCKEFTFTSDGVCFDVYFLNKDDMTIFALCYNGNECI